MDVGVLGGGQLGRMLALAGYALGARFRFLDPAPDAPMCHLARQVCGAYDDPAALDALARDTSVVTYEFENVPVHSALHLARAVPVYPPPDALRVAQDRVTEKTFFRSLGIPTAAFARASSRAELDAAVERLGLPAVLKTRSLGYDGKGQFLIRTREQVDTAWAQLGGALLVLEKWVDFTRELSILAVRGQDGTCAFYPLVENEHGGGILRQSLMPAPNWRRERQAQAEDYARRVLTALNYVGVLAIELFETKGALLANEMAPRVHNSGHLTIEGAVTSQFENHLRAILGMPLGATTARGYSAMVNLIGVLPDPREILNMPGAHLHLYDKAPRPGRKLGHVTLVCSNEEEMRERVGEIRERVGGRND